MTKSIEEIAREAKAIAENATPGPWRWIEDEERERIATKGKSGKWRAKPGYRLRDTLVYCLVGAPRYSPPADRFDYRLIAALPWYKVRGTVVMNARPEGSDADLIAHAGTHYGALASEVLRLRKLVAEMESAPR